MKLQQVPDFKRRQKRLEALYAPTRRPYVVYSRGTARRVTRAQQQQREGWMIVLALAAAIGVLLGISLLKTIGA